MDNTCLDDLSGFCIGQAIVTCEDGFKCNGTEGQAACAATTTEPPAGTAAIESCSGANLTCTNATAYCQGSEVTPCPSGEGLRRLGRVFKVLR